MHAFPSLQFKLAPGTHPVSGLHVSVPVQIFESSQFNGVFPHPDPGVHLSTVQAFPSSQLITVLTHPLIGSQESAVHGLPSLHSILMPGIHPAALSQVSVPLHTFLSSQFSGTLIQPPVSSQVSCVQALPSSQFFD